MKSFQSFSTPTILDEASGLFLTEADTTASTDFEQMICDLWNAISPTPNLSFEDFEQLMKKKGQPQKGIDRYITKHGGSKKIKIPKDKTEAYQVVHEFGKNLVQKGSKFSGKAVQVGATKPKVSDYWTEETKKNVDTSKTDIQIGVANISVKNGKNARLMSGGIEESIATIWSAAEHSGASEGARKKLIKLVEQYQTGRAWNQPGLESATAGNVAKLSKMTKKDRDKLLSDVNEKAYAAYEAGDKLREEVVDAFNAAFVKDTKFRNSFAYEACTGWEKFGGKVFSDAGDDDGRAEWMLAFSPDLTALQIYPMQSVSSIPVKKVAKAMSLRADFKSGSFDAKGKSVGYKFYQTTQLGLKTIFGEMDKLQKSTNEEVEKWENMLTEGLITELQMWDKIKSFVSKLWNGLKELWGKAKSLMLEMVNKLKQAIDDSLQSVMGFFDFGIASVNHRTEFKLL